MKFKYNTNILTDIRNANWILQDAHVSLTCSGFDTVELSITWSGINEQTIEQTEVFIQSLKTAKGLLEVIERKYSKLKIEEDL